MESATLRGSRFDNNPRYRNRYWRQQDFDAVDALGRIASHAGRSLVSVALNRLLHHTPVQCVILGASRRERLSENLAAAEEGPLDAGTLAAIDEVRMQLRGVTPDHNR